MPTPETAGTPLLVYRLIAGPEPTKEDFISDKARSKPLREASPEALAHHEGLSTWRSLVRLRRVARRFPKLGAYVAHEELPVGTTVLPFPKDPDHITVFGDPDTLRGYVVRVTPVE